MVDVGENGVPMRCKKKKTIAIKRPLWFALGCLFSLSLPINAARTTVLKHTCWYSRSQGKRFLSTLSPSTFKDLRLVALDWTRPKDPPFSLGHASILANLNAHQIPVTPRSWAVNRPDFSPNEVVDFIMKDAKPTTAAAIGAFVWNEKATQAILNALKRNKFPGKVILGGLRSVM